MKKLLIAGILLLAACGGTNGTNNITGIGLNCSVGSTARENPDLCKITTFN